MSGLFPPEYIHDEGLIVDCLLDHTVGTDLPKYLDELEQHLRQAQLIPTWLGAWTKQPQGPQNGARFENTKMQLNFKRGAHLAINGLLLTDAAQVVPRMQQDKLYYNYRPFRELVSSPRNQKPRPIMNIWLPGFVRMSDQAYAAIPSHHEALRDWSVRATATDKYPAMSGELYFKRGYSLVLAFSKSIIEAEARASFNDYMHVRMFDDDDSNAQYRWQSLTTMFTEPTS